MVLSRTETVILGKWPWSDVSRSSKVKLIMPSDSRHIISYTCSIVTIAQSRMETLFLSRWPWSDLSRSAKVELIMPSDSRPMICYWCSMVSIALSRTETLFFSRWPWSWPFKVTKGKTNYAIRFATHDLLSMFYSKHVPRLAKNGRRDRKSVDWVHV